MLPPSGFVRRHHLVVGGMSRLTSLLIYTVAGFQKKSRKRLWNILEITRIIWKLTELSRWIIAILVEDGGKFRKLLETSGRI